MEMRWVVIDSLNDNKEQIYSVYAEVRTRVKIKSSILTSKKKNVWYHKPEWCIATDIRNPFTGKPSYEYATFLAYTANMYQSLKILVDYINWRIPKEEQEVIAMFQVGKKIIRQLKGCDKILYEMPDRTGIFDSTEDVNGIGEENEEKDK